MKSLMIIGMSLLVDPPTGKAVQKSSYFGHTNCAGRVIAAVENVVVDVGESPMIVASEALGRPMAGTTNGCLFSSIGLA
jgi:hypothetical protein